MTNIVRYDNSGRVGWVNLDAMANATLWDKDVFLENTGQDCVDELNIAFTNGHVLRLFEKEEFRPIVEQLNVMAVRGAPWPSSINLGGTGNG